MVPPIRNRRNHPHHPIARGASPEKATILKDLTMFGRRARVELIELRGKLAVRKTFTPGAERFAQREITIRERFGARHPAIAPLLHAGPRHIIYEYAPSTINIYRQPDGRIRPHRLMPLHIARQAFAALRYLHENGYALLDFHPGNVLYSRSAGLRLIDFEFAIPYPGTLPPFEQSYAIVGVPPGFSGDLPESWDPTRTPFDAKWRPYTAATLDQLLHEPRILHFPRRITWQTSRAVQLQIDRAGRIAQRLSTALALCPPARLIHTPAPRDAQNSLLPPTSQTSKTHLPLLHSPHGDRTPPLPRSPRS